jgi:hypothetical protein
MDRPLFQKEVFFLQKMTTSGQAFALNDKESAALMSTLYTDNGADVMKHRFATHLAVSRKQTQVSLGG